VAVTQWVAATGLQIESLTIDANSTSAGAGDIEVAIFFFDDAVLQP
jgi:hypothetical protein